MHDDFADWYQSTNIDNDPRKLERRWKGVKQVSDKLDYAGIANLVKIAFDRGDEEAKSRFKEVFKKHDRTFLLKDNDHEVAVLASSVLAFKMSTDYDDAGLIATSILTTYFYKERKPAAEFDLIGIANNTITKNSHSARNRPVHEGITVRNTTKKIIADKIEELAQEEDWHKLAEVLNFMTEQILNHTKQSRDALQKHIKPVWDYIAVQDEELEMAWWLVNKWCQLAEKPFNKVPTKMRPLLFGKEIADMIHVNIEPPSLIGMLNTAGVGKNKLTIPEAVNACGNVNLSNFQNLPVACATLTPIHNAIGRAIETDCEDSWIPAWQKVCGITQTNKFSAIDIAIQIHRECVVLMNLADNGNNE